MRKYSIKRELSYHEGAYTAINDIMDDIDKLISESYQYEENKKLWQLRDKVVRMYNLSIKSINTLKKELNK